MGQRGFCCTLCRGGDFAVASLHEYVQIRRGPRRITGKRITGAFIPWRLFPRQQLPRQAPVGVNEWSLSSDAYVVRKLADATGSYA